MRMGLATLLAATLRRSRSRLPATHAVALYHSAFMRYLLALDQGTTNSRVLLFDERAALLGIPKNGTRYAG